MTTAGVSPAARGLASADAEKRLQEFGPNALRSHGARPFSILLRQLHNPLLLLLLAAAMLSAVTGDGTDAVIVGVIASLSVGLGFFDEFRSERAVELLHSQLRSRATVIRDGRPQSIDVVELVPGDVVRLSVGDVVPADMRVLEADELQCDEAVLTGESMPASKQAGAADDDANGDVFMGTVVNDGAGLGVVTRTGTHTSFGRIAIGLGERHAETAFQSGLRAFSAFLVRVAVVLSTFVFVVNVLLSRPVAEALLFSLAIAIGITPQLLPAIVTVSLSTGSRRLAHRKVLVKRLVSIEDLGNITLLFTDKTGTLTDGHIEYERAIEEPTPGCSALELGLLCNEASLAGTKVVSGNALDVALWRGAPEVVETGARRWKRVATRPFDHGRRWGSVIVEDPNGRRRVIMKGEPERVLARCIEAPTDAAMQLHQLYEDGARVVAVASKDVEHDADLAKDLEQELEFGGFLVFADRVKTDAAASLDRLARLGIAVKIITGDSAEVARKVCSDLGMDLRGSLTGDEVDAMDDAELARRIDETTVFARTGPETKARIVRVQRDRGADVAFLGDGVNDAVALHHADVGISVDTATDVAKDAADIILLDKDLGVLADGVVEGRRIFANTIKYILMATSSNFGNMFSAASASLFLSFLPMLPTQILLNNLLYDVSQMTIPTDNVDEELLQRPSAWDIAFIRRFMLFFGPISSAFDFATFGLMLWVLNAAAPEFRTGWFVESLATQTLVIFVIRTRRHPFWRSRPSTPLLCASLLIPVVGVVIPYLPFASQLGFTHLPAAFYVLLTFLVVAYLATVEIAKHHFFAAPAPTRPLAARRPHAMRRLHRRATRFSRRRRVSAS